MDRWQLHMLVVAPVAVLVGEAPKWEIPLVACLVQRWEFRLAQRSPAATAAVAPQAPASQHRGLAAQLRESAARSGESPAANATLRTVLKAIPSRRRFEDCCTPPARKYRQSDRTKASGFHPHSLPPSPYRHSAAPVRSADRWPSSSTRPRSRSAESPEAAATDSPPDTQSRPAARPWPA